MLCHVIVQGNKRAGVNPLIYSFDNEKRPEEDDIYEVGCLILANCLSRDDKSRQRGKMKGRMAL